MAQWKDDTIDFGGKSGGVQAGHSSAHEHEPTEVSQYHLFSHTPAGTRLGMTASRSKLIQEKALAKYGHPGAESLTYDMYKVQLAGARPRLALAQPNRTFTPPPKPPRFVVEDASGVFCPIIQVSCFCAD